MTTVVQALILGIIQGLTEFFPVSSSGHLVLAEHVLGWDHAESRLPFSIAVHFGSLVAVLMFVREELVSMLRTDRRLMAVLAVASVPIVAVVAFTPMREWLEVVSVPAVVGVLLLAMAVLLMWIRRQSGEREERDIPMLHAFLIGCVQVIAILPGVSRSGVTLAAGIRTGLRPSQALRFAFLLAVPAIGGAFVHQLVNGGFAQQEIGVMPLVVGALASFVVSVFAMRVMVRVVKDRNLGWFAGYCAIVGTLALAGHFLA